MPTPTPTLLVLLVLAAAVLASCATRLPPGEGESQRSAVLALSSDGAESDDVAETETETTVELSRKHSHHHDRDDHGRDRRCRIDECGWVKRCKDIYVGRICWSIYCYCGSDHGAEISVDDDADGNAPAVTVAAVEEGERRVHKDRRCGEDECGWIRWCKHTYIGKVCWNVYCHCHREDVVGGEEDSEVAAEAVEAALRRDERCGAEECGWVPDCVDTPAGRQCWDIFCYCSPSDAVQLELERKAEAEGVVDAEPHRDNRCRDEDCGWVQDCVPTPAGPQCWDIFCYCDANDAHRGEEKREEEGEGEGLSLVGAAPGRDERCEEDDCGWVPQCVDTPVGPKCWDIFCYCDPEGVVEEEDGLQWRSRCSKHECGEVERCVMKESGVEICWTVTCKRGCAELLTTA